MDELVGFHVNDKPIEVCGAIMMEDEDGVPTLHFYVKWEHHPPTFVSKHIMYDKAPRLCLEFFESRIKVRLKFLHT